MKTILGLTMLTLLLSGCKSHTQIPEHARACQDPRPQMCTMDYKPACGFQNDDAVKTYSNACQACSNPEVKWVVEGSCDQTKK